MARAQAARRLGVDSRQLRALAFPLALGLSTMMNKLAESPERAAEAVRSSKAPHANPHLHGGNAR